MPSSSDTNKRLKKGTLWSKEEDEILKAYVEKHGTGNWKEVSKNTGLAHCGNSCRFRWYNTLRPDLRKGPFSKEEEEKFFELFSKFGEFKWSKMALEMPGRTDNDIKNFWNARKRKHQRHGLMSPFTDNMELVDGLKSSNGKRIRNSQENKFKIQEVKFGNQILHTNLFDLPYNVGSTSTSNHTTSTLIDRDGVGTSTISIPNMGYPQNPQPMETQYQLSLSQSISPYKSGSLKSMLYTQENWESLDTIRMHFETNLVDEKGKKQISSESDVEVNHEDIMNTELWDDMFSTLVNDDDNNLHDKLPCDVNDALDTCMKMQSDLPPLPPPMETQHQMSEINNWKKAIALEEGVDENQIIFFENYLYGYLV